MRASGVSIQVLMLVVKHDNARAGVSGQTCLKRSSLVAHELLVRQFRQSLLGPQALNEHDPEGNAGNSRSGVKVSGDLRAHVVYPLTITQTKFLGAFLGPFAVLHWLLHMNQMK